MTACFYEVSAVKVLFDLVSLFLLTKNLPIPSYEQYGLYCLFSILACTIATSVYCFVGFYILAKEEILITPIYGFNGVLISVLMYARKLYRDQSVHYSVPAITYNNLPLLLIAFQAITAYTPEVQYIREVRVFSYDIIFSLISLFFSWSYLRFYFKYSDSIEYGDKSDEFAFVMMFPERLHIVFIPLTTAFYNVIALLGIYPPLDTAEKRPYHHLRSNADSSKSSYDVNGSGPHEHVTVAVVSKVDPLAERRRAKALKLLDAKMAQLSQEPEGWDDMGSANELGHESEYSKLKV